MLGLESAFVTPKQCTPCEVTLVLTLCLLSRAASVQASGAEAMVVAADAVVAGASGRHAHTATHCVVGSRLASVLIW
jgi:hypothetical protein